MKGILGKFEDFMQEKKDKTKECSEIYKKEDLDGLPEGIRKYISYTGCIGKKKHDVVNVKFMDTDFFMNGKKMKIDYSLWLFKEEPYRAASIKTSMYGIPFEGVDYCDEKAKIAGMKGVIAKIIPIFNIYNKQMYRANLISWIVEGMMNPCILLSKYIEYREIDENNIEATVNYNGVVGRGIFTIDDSGRIVKFTSDERQMEKINGVDTPLGWRCEMEDYKEINSMNLPSKLKVITIYKDRELEYFSSKNIQIKYYK